MLRHAALRLGGSWSRYKNAAGLYGPSLDREHRCLRRGGWQADTQHLGQVSSAIFSDKSMEVRMLQITVTVSANHEKVMEEAQRLGLKELPKFMNTHRP